jgi:glutamate/aspartate transport system substrate-binding protein
MLRKDDPELAEVVERAFHKLAGSREIVAIYERWFTKPLPSGERLNLPMSPHLEEIFRVQGLPATDARQVRAAQFHRSPGGDRERLKA